MKHIALISIIILGLFGCKTQQAKEISERDVATLAARCVNALQNKAKYWDEFNFNENVTKLCEEFGMSSRVIPISELDKKVDFFEGVEHKIVGKDSLSMVLSCGILANKNKSVNRAVFDVLITNPIRYGTIVPKRYKDAIYEEFRRQGWYSEFFERWNFDEHNHKILLNDDEFTEGFYIAISYDSTR